jgi:cell division protein FtsI (penicillin-binding protein 3)
MSAAVDGYLVAGKTGTAQKVDPVTRSYSADKRTASFVGFIPADNPRLTILVIIDEPKTSPYGGVVAAPAFREIAQQALCYLNVPPAKSDKPRKEDIQVGKVEKTADPVDSAAEGAIIDTTEGGLMADYRGQSMRQVLRVMEKKGLNMKLIGSGRAVEQNPPPGHRIAPSDHVWVRFVPSG